MELKVAVIPRCAECNQVWLPADEDRWQAHFDSEDDLVFYCRECAEREFGRRFTKPS
jgi:RNase P subunit RPR2